MPSRRPETWPAPFARLPRGHHHGHVLHSTVDAFGRAHWLLTERPPDRARADPYDAVIVTAEGGSVHETHLGAVPARHPHVEALPDGGFVVADARSTEVGPQVQVFDVLGRCTWTFRIGDAVEHLLADASGDLWAGYGDVGIHGDDELSRPGLRRWSSTGEPLWTYRPVPGSGWISHCYALNVAGRSAWACPYTDFPLLQIRDDRVVRVRENPVQGASGLAVHGDRVVFFGGYDDDRDRLVHCRLTERTVEVVAEGRLARPDGVRGHRRVVSRGPRLYVQERPFTEWFVVDIS